MLVSDEALQVMILWRAETRPIVGHLGAHITDVFEAKFNGTIFADLFSQVVGVITRNYPDSICLLFLIFGGAETIWIFHSNSKFEIVQAPSHFYSKQKGKVFHHTH